MERRLFVKYMGVALTSTTLLPLSAESNPLVKSPVRTNILRPPGAVPEELFPAKCIRCGRCVEVCPYRSITLLDIRHGLHAGTPIIDVVDVPCYLCMKCVDVCPTGSLRRLSQEDTRMGLAVVNRFLCARWTGKTLCRTCYDKCPYPEQAIVLDQLKPVINEAACTGCGLCSHGCPVTDREGRKAVNIEPIYAKEKVIR